MIIINFIVSIGTIHVAGQIIMKTKQCTVYATVFGSVLHLREYHTGTRRQCQKWIENQKRIGHPTHWFFVSSLNIDAATKKYLK